jgi:hypothetical protein
MTTRTFITWDKLPLFADDSAIGAAVLGHSRANEWRGIAALYEGQGMPKMDPVHGGRYVPAVKAFYDHVYRLGQPATAAAPAAPDGVERPETWTRSKRRA